MTISSSGKNQKARKKLRKKPKSFDLFYYEVDFQRWRAVDVMNVKTPHRGTISRSKLGEYNAIVRTPEDMVAETEDIFATPSHEGMNTTRGCRNTQPRPSRTPTHTPWIENTFWSFEGRKSAISRDDSGGCDNIAQNHQLAYRVNSIPSSEWKGTLSQAASNGVSSKFAVNRWVRENAPSFGR